MDTKDKIIEFIDCYIEANGFGPSLRDLGDGVGVSYEAARKHLDKLEESGALQAFGFRLVKPVKRGQKQHIVRIV